MVTEVAGEPLECVAMEDGDSHSKYTRCNRGVVKAGIEMLFGRQHNLVFKRSQTHLGSTFYGLLTCFSSLKRE